VTEKSDRFMEIGPKALQDLIRACRTYSSDMATTQGEMAQKIGEAVEKKGLNKKVFSLIRKLDAMEDDKIAEFMEVFEDYYVKAGLKKRAENAPNFWTGKTKGAERTELEADEAEQERSGAATH
jgi:hypothetical protein